MGITEQNIKDYIEKAGQQAGEHTSVWAVRMPSVINMALFGPASVLFDMRYNILNITDDGMMLIGVDAAGRLTPMHMWFSKETIQRIKIKKGMISYDIEMKTAGGSLKYRINKIMIGSSFHKANVDAALRLLEQFQ